CADAALTHSQFTCRELHDHTGFPADRLFELDYPLDTLRFCPGGKGHSLRQELGLSSERLLLFVGRLAPNKRLPVLIEALDRLRDCSPTYHAVVVGNADDVYRTEAEHCRQRAAELGVADRLHWLGHVSEDRLLDAYRSADLLVMPSRHEGFCIPVIEAMAFGLPVVAARAAAPPATLGAPRPAFTP